MQDKYLEKLCNWLRDAEEQEEVQCAAEALRTYLREQHLIIRQRLDGYLRKAFARLGSDQYQSN